MEPWIRASVLVVGGVLLLSLLQFLLSIVPPKFSFNATPQDYGWTYETVQFETSDGQTLSGWFIPATNETNRTVIVGHGYPADKNNVLPYARFLHNDFNLFFFDFRSFGDSTGIITTGGLHEQRDVEAAVNWLKQEKPGKAERIGGYGFSMSAATFLMQHSLFDGIVAEAPYADLGQMINRLYFYLGPVKPVLAAPTKLYSRVVFGVWPATVSPVNDIKDSETPVFLIHGEDDNEIPVNHSRQIYRAAPMDTTELWIVEGAGHGTTQAVAGETYRDRVTAFFNTSLK